MSRVSCHVLCVAMMSKGVASAERKRSFVCTIFRAELVVAVFLVGPLLDVDADPPTEPGGVGHAHGDQVAVVGRGRLRDVRSQVRRNDFRPGVLVS